MARIRWPTAPDGWVRVTAGECGSESKSRLTMVATGRMKTNGDLEAVPILEPAKNLLAGLRRDCIQRSRPVPAYERRHIIGKTYLG